MTQPLLIKVARDNILNWVRREKGFISRRRSIDVMNRYPFSKRNKLCTGTFSVRLFTEIQVKTRSAPKVSLMAHEFRTRNSNLPPDYPQS